MIKRKKGHNSTVLEIRKGGIKGGIKDAKDIKDTDTLNILVEKELKTDEIEKIWRKYKKNIKLYNHLKKLKQHFKTFPPKIPGSGIGIDSNNK